VLIALPVMAASGAAMTAVLLALTGSWVCARSSAPELRQLLRWTLGAGALAASTAEILGGWIWRIPAAIDAWGMLRLLTWFTWPVWPLVAWTLWKWRRHILRRHLAVPLTTGGVAVITSLAMGGSDRALMLALPALAVLAAFALPTLRRSMSAAIDWFSVFFFSACAITIWVIYAAMHTQVPPKIAANVARLAPGFEAPFQALALVLAVLGTLAWLGLVRWRTGRQQHALWKSLVLPAGGVALNWLLLMTLWLPLLDYARSYRPLVQRIAQQLPPSGCVNTVDLSRSQLAALSVHGNWTPVPLAGEPACEWLLVAWRLSRTARFEPPVREGWVWISKIERPTDKEEAILIYRRRH
jgi:4-amino-4-deoxy-L-arabinose transferase-like glycosyltransferase